MPIYEYQCQKCGRVSNFLVRIVSSHQPPTCPRCGHKRMDRLFSRFAAIGAREKTEGDGGGDRMDMPPGLDGLDENDPRSMGRFMRKMMEESGETVEPEMDEVCRRLEAGEDPESIEESMGDLLGDEGPGGGGGVGGPRDDTLYEG